MDPVNERRSSGASGGGTNFARRSAPRQANVVVCRTTGYVGATAGQLCPRWLLGKRDTFLISTLGRMHVVIRNQIKERTSAILHRRLGSSNAARVPG